MKENNDILDMGGISSKSVETGRIDDGSFNGTMRSFDVFLPLGKYFGKRGDEFVLDISEYSFLVTNQNEDLHKYTRSVNASIKSSRGLDRIFGEPVSVICNVEGGIGCFGAMTTMTIPAL